jgi:hypothetical protein
MSLDTRPPPRKRQFARRFPARMQERIETRRCGPAERPEPLSCAWFADALKESTTLERDSKKSVADAARHDRAEDVQSSSGPRREAKAPQPAAEQTTAAV